MNPRSTPFRSCPCVSLRGPWFEFNPYSLRVPRRSVPGVPAAARRRALLPQRPSSASGRSRVTTTCSPRCTIPTRTARATASRSSRTTRCRCCSPPIRPITPRCAALVSRAFTPRRVADLEPDDPRAVAARSSTRCVDRGDGDLIADYAARLPMDVIARMLGVPGRRRGAAARLDDALLDRDEGVPDVTPAGIDAATQLYKYFSRVRRRPARAIAPATRRRPHRARCVAAGADGERSTTSRSSGSCSC